MKKIILMLLASAFFVVSMSSCKKGENDPLLSFKSRKGRITGEWTLVSNQRTIKSVDSDGDGTETYYSVANGVRTVENRVLDNNSTTATTTDLYDYSLTSTLEKEGTMKVVETFTQTSAAGTDIPAASQITVTINANGHWTFIGKNKERELGNKEGFLFTFESHQVSTTGAATTNTNHDYEGFNDGYVHLIDQLKNKEMILMVNHSNTDNDGGVESFDEITTMEKN